MATMRVACRFRSGPDANDKWIINSEEKSVVSPPIPAGTEKGKEKPP